jgi:hypothetical protein
MRHAVQEPMLQAQQATRVEELPRQSANKNRTDKGEVSSLETSEKKTSFVQFKTNVEEIEPDNESDKEDERKTSLGELWAFDAKTKTGPKLEEASHFIQQFHPVTIMSFSDKFGGRLVCTALTDQCCTGNGIITDDFANALRCEITKAQEMTTYSRAGGDFVSQYEISIKDAMLPCMSTT